MALVLLDPASFAVEDVYDNMEEGEYRVPEEYTNGHASNIHVLIEDTSHIWVKVGLSSLHL